MTIHFITETAKVEALLPTLMSKKAWGFDLETTGLDPYLHKPNMMQIGRRDEQFVIDMRSAKIDALRPFLESRDIKKVGHNLKFDYMMLAANHGIELECMRDTMIADKLLNVGITGKKFGLADVIHRRMGIVLDKSDRKEFTRIGNNPFTKDMIEYGAKDVSHMCDLFTIISKDIGEVSLGQVLIRECEFIAVMGDMELAGLHFDKDRWKANLDETLLKVSQAEKELYEMVYEFQQNGFAPEGVATLFPGEVNFNLNSNAQVLQLLKNIYVEVSTVDYKTKTLVKKLINGTESKELLKAEPMIPFIEKLLAYRKHTKLASTYGMSYINAIHPVTGRIHPKQNQLGTETGRLANDTWAKNNPNMLNIPRDKKYRHCFVSGSDDYVIETDDFSGAELRIWAELSKDPVLSEAFIRGEDVHCTIASKMYGVPVVKGGENKHLRSPAKSINFGIAYDMSPPSLFFRIRQEGFKDITLEKAFELHESYCTLVKKGVDFLRNNGRMALKEGYSVNVSGRRRYYELPPKDDWKEYNRIANKVLKKGGNFGIQSVNAEITKDSMIELRRYIKENKIRSQMILQVYDEVVTRTHKDDSPDFVKKKRQIMVDSAQKWLKRVPMEVEGEVMDSWTK